MKKLLRLAAAVAVAGSIGATGIVGASSGSISGTGPDSDNTITWENDNETTVENNNDVSATNSVSQTAYSGDVKVKRNTTADGDAESGAASNDSSVSASMTVDNTGAADAIGGGNGSGDDDATIDNTGPDSDNHITFNNTNTTTLTNNNTLYVTNSVSQTAYSGDVTVERNTTAGGATSGDASNTSTSEFIFEVSN